MRLPHPIFHSSIWLRTAWLRSAHAAISVAVLLCLAAGAAAQVTLPSSATVKPGRILIIKADAKADAKVIFWCLEWRQGIVDLVPIANGQVAFASPAPGRFLVLAFVDGASAPAECVVTVEGAGPEPGPKPIPPPIDPLIAALRQAYAADAGLGKAVPDKIRDIKAIYDQAEGFIGLDKTIGEAQARINNAILLGVFQGKTGNMPNLARAINTHFEGVLPKDPKTPLTDALRAVYGQAARQVGTALGRLFDTAPPKIKESYLRDA